MRRCPVTGRTHLSPRELKAALIRLDTQLLALHVIVAQFQAAFTSAAEEGELPEPVRDAWNAALSAIDALAYHRAEVEANPRPLPAGEADLYAMVKDNID